MPMQKQNYHFRAPVKEVTYSNQYFYGKNFFCGLSFGLHYTSKHKKLRREAILHDIDIQIATCSFIIKVIFSHINHIRFHSYLDGKVIRNYYCIMQSAIWEYFAISNIFQIIL